jgi:membrane-bound lytic murein transglycosylase MltF
MLNNLRICVNKKTLNLIPVVLILVSFAISGCMRPSEGLDFLQQGKPEQKAGLSPGDFSQITLDPLTEKSLQRYGKVVSKYAERYEFDARLILAIMKQESRFKPNARSHRGAYGLMQIMPITELELAMKLGVENTKSPYNNIRAGIYHLRSLYRVFEGIPEEDRLMLSLAAYNAGLSRILDAQDVAAFLGDDPRSWKAVREALPLLTKRYSSLHTSIWSEGTPRGGYFKGWRETTGYVGSIMKFYGEYQQRLPDPLLAGL